MLAAAPGDYTLSQTHAFGMALARAYPEYRYEPALLDFSDGRGALLPLVRVARRPRALRCFEAMPLSLNGAPVGPGPALSSEHLAAALEALRADSLVLNASATCNDVSASLAALGIGSCIPCTSHVLDLEGGFDLVWSKRFSGRVRNQCRLAERRGVVVRGAAGAADFEAYYRIYEASSARWGRATPPYPWALFRELASLAGRGVSLRLAEVEGRPVAGVLVLEGRRSALYWSGAFLKEFAAWCPNDALLREAIAEACRQGRAWFDFGSSGSLEGVRRFKESFGARPLSYQTFVLRSRRQRGIEGLKRAFRGLGLRGRA